LKRVTPKLFVQHFFFTFRTAAANVLLETNLHQNLEF
jgi:hypothetical protein